MWRSTVFPENENSDQSISEDDDLNEDLLEDHVSLGNPAQKKCEVQILSQLDMLRGTDANEVVHERNQTSLLYTRQIDTCVEPEDDVEFPNFANKDEITYTLADEEILFKNQGTGNCMQLSTSFTSEADNYQNINPFSSRGNRKGVCTWLAENADADALINVNDNCASFHSLSSKLKRSSKGGQVKAKHKFSIRTQLHNDNLNKDSSDVYEGHASIKEKEMDGMTNYMTPAGFPISHTHSTTLVAELLLRVQDEHDLPEGSTVDSALLDAKLLSSRGSHGKQPLYSYGVEYNKTEGQFKERVVKRSILSTDHSDIDDDPDCLDSDSSEDNEVIMQELKQKTIADQFHEALGAASTNEDDPVYAVPAVPQRTSFGLFSKLKRVMQSEKEKDSIFLNKLHKQDEAGCLDVKILSKTLEGKLTVCLCSCVEDNEISTSTDNNRSIVKRKNTTIIFSSRICGDVELDVGTRVRIHPPWKEVSIKGKNKSAILSTYFSQI